jgi:hypothetical protein
MKRKIRIDVPADVLILGKERGIKKVKDEEEGKDYGKEEEEHRRCARFMALSGNKMESESECYDG